MVARRKAEAFVRSQQSLHLYKKVQKAFVDVLTQFTNEEFHQATDNIILMVLHEGALGQVMHFPATRKKFEIMQLTVPKAMPINIMRYVISHEFGHVMQNRNWKKSDGQTLETDADSWATKWGFPPKKSYREWIKKPRIVKRNY